MVITTETLPCAPLQPYIRTYTLREFNTLGNDFIKPLPANHEFTIAFTLSGSIGASNPDNEDFICGSRKHIIGLQTANRGAVIFNGDIKLFTIHFKPNGFYKLFNIPVDLITNNIFEASELINKDVIKCEEQLSDANDLATMKTFADQLLLSQLVKSKMGDPYNSITATAALISQDPSKANIKNLAYEANMSLKKFELKFTKQVGLPPKLFARITRFNYALLMKAKNMSNSWTDISHKCGYYDQTHFIKEFKEFAGDSPSNFYKTTPLPSEDYRKQ